MVKFIRFTLGVLVAIWLILVVVAPLVEFGKIMLFVFVRKEHKIELNSTIEFIYFLISFLVPWWIVTSNCCACFTQVGLTPKELKTKLFIMVFVWIALSVNYAYFTRNDIEDIPLFCPSDYPYPVPKLRLACIIRAANYIVMWTYTDLLVIFLIAVLAGILPKEEDLIKKNKDFNIKTIIEEYVNDLI
ncbi:hypothetical protein C1645_769919 [Glomus cerebriforme]|uniref:Uncharacterized protein n=1 Tax=Glomus cerebriforme TaxID=658196 RepID=A0A397SWL8_9GLOM|nr:hypothetical protein C1645_769919 [Glomus cerebriforme]